MFLFMEDAFGDSNFDNVVTNVAGEWTLLTKTFSVPLNIKKLRLRLDINAQGNIWFDVIGNSHWHDKLYTIYYSLHFVLTIITVEFLPCRKQKWLSCGLAGIFASLSATNRFFI